MFKTREQLIIRFLKNKDLYNRIKCLYSNGFKVEYINERFSGVNFFDKLFNWSSTREGHNFWLKIQCEFILFIIENDKNNLYEKNSVKEYFSYILNKGYFVSDVGGDRLSKKSDFYLKFEEKYKKIFGF